MRGYLVIYIGGYKLRLSNAGRIFMSGTKSIIVPDHQIPAEIYPFGTTDWIDEGWAVGDNPRERFCKWNSGAPLRKFHDYDEAVQYVFRLRQKRKRPNEVYTLIYYLNGPSDVPSYRPVSSMDDVLVFEHEIDQERLQHRLEIAARRQSLEVEYPQLEFLVTHVGRRDALSLSLLLKSIRDNGIDQTRAVTPDSTFYRGVKELRRLGLVETPLKSQKKGMM